MSDKVTLFDVAKGFLIDGKVAILYGPGSPTGDFIDVVGIGSLWLSESDGSIFKKISMATGSQSWNRITEASRKNLVIDNISSETVVDQEYTNDVSSLTWQLILTDKSDPTVRRSSTVTCIHDGSSDDEADHLSFEEHSILYSKNPKPSTLVNTQVKVEVFGSYPNQVFQLVVIPPEGTTLEALLTRIVIMPQDNVTTISVGPASKSVIGLVRLATTSEVNNGTPQSVVTGEELKKRVEKSLVQFHRPVVLVTDPLILNYDIQYNPDFITVYLNRLKLRPTEYEATNGSSIRFLIELELNDEIEVVTIPNYGDPDE